LARTLSRRRFLLGGVGITGVAVLAACAPAATPQVVEKVVEKEVTKVVKETVVVEREPTLGPPVTMVAHFTFSPTYKPRIEGWTEAFKQRYPNIDVELVFEPWGEWQTKILTLAAAGQMPELVAVHIARAQILAQQGALLPLDDWIAADPEFDIDDFYPQSLLMFTYEGKLYGFPWDWGCGILAYNKDLFDQAGIDYPDSDWTFDDLLAAAQAITDLSEDTWGYYQLPYASCGGGEQFLVPWGGGFVNDDETECLVDTPESIEALQWWADLRLKHQVHPWPADEEALRAVGAHPFHTGLVGMTRLPPWSAGEVKEYADISWDVADWPKGPVTRSAGAAGSGYSIGRDTKHPEEAWLYIRWFASKEGHEFLWGETGASIPARESAYEAFLSAPGMPEHAQLWIDALKTYALLSRPISPPANEFLTIVRREFDLIFLGEKPVDEGATAICTDAAPVLAENK